MKLFFYLIFLLLLQQQSQAQHIQNFDFKKIYSYALQEDVQKILSVLDTLNEATLTDEQKIIKEKYFKRFRYNNEVEEPATKDTVINQLLNIYQLYWKNVLLDKKNSKQYEEELRQNVTQFLIDNNYKNDSITKEEISKKFTQFVKDFLLQRAYFSATGKTASLFDLLIWQTEIKKIYIEQLPETVAQTPVVFIENTVSMGWEEYATFGVAYPGGWATKEILYCVRKAYDTTSENFKVSYLKHEAQHFADYKVYPLLTGADLEYRAKLTELVYADETLYNIIRTFLRNGNSEGRNPHAFANYILMRDLSKKIFKKDVVTDIEEWKKISKNRIKNESKKLLKAHSKALQKAGAKTVTELIK